MLNRRRFLQTSASAAALSVAAPAILRGRNLNSRLQIAAVGCDGKGWSDTDQMAQHKQVAHVGFCDVDLARTQKVRELNSDVPVFQDYREMFQQLGDRIDAVTVSTPDHMHACISLEAMKQGKHLFCQKPLTHNVWEARQMRLWAARSGVITRMGNQIHSHGFYRTAAQIVQAGLIGKVRRVHSWCRATGHGKSGHVDRPKKSPPVPDSLDWNLWLGVAPPRPYGGDRVYHPWGWRDWQDFGNGALGDFGCHILDPVFTALKITGAPRQLEATHSGMNDETWPAQTNVDYIFPGTEFTEGDSLPISWYDGGLIPRRTGSHVPSERALPGSGSLLIGQEGTLVVPHVGQPQLYPEAKYEQVDVPQEESLNHYHGWVDGCLAGQQPSDGFDYAGPLTEAVLLGNIAVRYRGQSLHWDPEALTITNLDEANQWLTRDYRVGWEIGVA